MDANTEYMDKCITCLGETPIMHSLSEMFDDYIDLSGVLKVCLQCEVNKNYFPRNLCQKCKSLLKEFFHFKMRFLNNEVILRDLLGVNTENEVFGDENSEIPDEQKLDSVILEDFKDIESVEEEIIFEVVDEELKPDFKEIQDGYNTYKDSIIKERDTVISQVHDQVKLDENVQHKEVELDDDVFPDEKVSISEKPTKFKCSVCKTFFIDSLALDFHLVKHKKHKCDICGSIFVKKNYLSDHMITHKSIRDIECPLCPKAFKSRHTMRAHMRIHTDPGAFVCENCGRSFTHRSSLKTHLKLKHSQKRDYLCLGCGMKFNLKSSLDKHTLRKHSSKDSRTTYKCLYCKGEYLNKSTLDRHFKTKHSPNYEFVNCELCPKVFSDKSNLLRHKRTKHSEELV